jgi:hypothetical protein
VLLAEGIKRGLVHIFSGLLKGVMYPDKHCGQFCSQLMRNELIFRLGQLKETNNKKLFFQFEGGEIKRKTNTKTAENEVDEFRVCSQVSLFTLKGRILETMKGGD